ncbi:MAG TPA: hypothetical protein VE398_09740 [Acidobacteriota bacterium]|nr:hypothetical protein [Acidobacteriota bacterium]
MNKGQLKSVPGNSMNTTWISEKAPGLLAVLVGLGFVGIAFFDAQYRYFHLAVAAISLYFGYKRISRQETPFQKRERELRRNIR